MSQFIFPTLECTENLNSYGKFVTTEPHLPKGFGIIVGNTLRRTLLGSLVGTAVTWVRVDGIQHEFSTMPNVKEDVIEFLLNVRSLRLRATGDGWPKKMVLDITGEKEIHADSIKPGEGLEVVNPELYLGTLESAEGHLVVEFNVEQGVGYKVASRVDNMITGSMPVDAIFTPVHRVNFKVEAAGVAMDRERLILEVWTDGTIEAVDAVPQSAAILTDCFKQFTSLSAAAPQLVAETPKVEQSSDHYNTKLESIGLPPRVVRALARNHINSVGELLEKSDEDLLDMPKFGRKSLEEVKKILIERGFIDAASAGLDKISQLEGDGSEEESDEA